MKTTKLNLIKEKERLLNKIDEIRSNNVSIQEEIVKPDIGYLKTEELTKTHRANIRALEIIDKKLESLDLQIKYYD